MRRPSRISSKPVGDAEWNSKVEKRLEVALKLNIPKLVMTLVEHFKPTTDDRLNAVRLINTVAAYSKYTPLLPKYLDEFSDANDFLECMKSKQIEISDKTKVLIFDHFLDGERAAKRFRMDANAPRAVCFAVDPDWPDSRVIVIDGVSIL
ncbi:hypothetical protein PFISCL1PPCAC_7823, partial [Pristionchus fissidentatus]